jgi:Fe-S cluster assembly protein SufD
MSIQVSTANSKPSLATAARTQYLARLLEIAQAAPAPVGLQALRDHAAVRVQEQTFPSTRDEEWRFTDLTDLLAVELHPSRPVSVTLAAIAAYTLPNTARLVFVNGVYAAELSNISDLPALTVDNLANLSDQQLVEPYLGKQSGAEEVFTALNTAGLSDAAVLLVRKNLVVDQPIHLLFVATADQPQLIQPRSLVIAEANSSLTLIEDYISLGETVYFNNSVTEIWLAENAQVNHTRLQRQSKTAFDIGKTAISQARSSRYTSNAFSFGAKLSRHNLEIYQTGEQTETTLNGLTVLRDEQVGDTHSTIALTKPYGTSRQLQKCIIDDRAHAIFNGKVFVPKAAQLTDAGQLNRNLLLSSKARVDTKPQLEIVADNVKCTHGATVGQLETDEIFYLQSRGIDANSARQLLVNAFAYEVIERVPLDPLRQILIQQVIS